MNADVQKTNRKAELLANTIEHVAIDAYDARPIIDAMRKMSFTSRDTARAADIWSMSLEDAGCSTWLTLAGSTSAGGCMHIYRDMIRYGMIDVVVATGASIVDMDFFEALGFKHYQAQSNVDDRDLRDLYIGSEGTLGVITAATLKLYPLPAARLTAWAAVASMDEAVALLGLAQQHLGANLTGFEVMGQFALSLVVKHFAQLKVPFHDSAAFGVLLECSDQESEAHARAQFERLLEAALAKGCISDAVVAESLAQARQLWHVRESIPLAQAEEGLNIKHDISVPVSRIPEFVRSTDALLKQALPGVRLVNFGHLGDGNLHYKVQAPAGVDAAVFMREREDVVNTLVFDAVQRFGGSISAEHGVGTLKVSKLEQHKSPVALSLMRSIKTALDPHNLMNPGKLLRR